MCIYFVSNDTQLCLYTKAIDGFLRILTTRLEHYRGEIGVVGRVGEVLCLETDGAATWEGGSVLTFVAIGPVVGINLYARLGGKHLHGASAYGLSNLGSKAQFAFFFFVQHKAVVVSGTVLYLFVVGINILSHSFGLSEIEGSAFYKAYFASRN